MILADTSAWVEYDRATGSAVQQRVRDLIAVNGPLAADGDMHRIAGVVWIALDSASLYTP